jgi:tetratricopeptide (TPR) repeat protein
MIAAEQSGVGWPNTALQAARVLLSCLLPLMSAFASSSDGTYVGRAVCSSCHQEQAKAWQNSHHDLAMMEATEDSVRGDFNSARLEVFGVETLFYRDNGRFMVRTDGPDGAMHDYTVKYTFGVTPLQQYLFEFPGGRLQALDIAWDSRPAEQGGQRWFALHPGVRSTPDDVLHWTGPNLNWNYMCADCHSTNLRKNYDASTETYNTTWSEIDVSCEACHGPGQEHVQWSRQAAAGRSDAGGMGLAVRFTERRGVTWPQDPITGQARRSVAGTSNVEIEVCARCHSRRQQISDDWAAGQPYLDAFVPALLTEGLYHADGQIEDEVYVWGSFLQSRMYQAGVTCSDCHDPHSARLRLPGDQVCAQCHATERYASRSHHFHQPGSAGSSCLQCHMPAQLYMVVDARRDHSMRVPRPDLSQAIGTPNACNMCHADQSAAWAAERIRGWYGHDAQGWQSYARALAAARQEKAEARGLLQQVVADAGQAAIARATASRYLDFNADQRAMDLLRQSLAAKDPLLKLGALAGLGSMPPQARIMAFPLLGDEFKAVRIEAARLLAGIPAGGLETEQRALLDRGIEEYVAAQQFNAERPESQINLGNLYADLGRLDEAEICYRQALRLQPRFEPAYVNLAHLLGGMQRDQEATDLLTGGLQLNPGSAALQHALGLSLVRQRQLDKALGYLAEAANAAPEEARFSYVYAIALNSTGQTAPALQQLVAAQLRHPGNADILVALVTINRDAGNRAAAQEYALKLKALLPENPAVEQLLNSLQG